MIEILRVKWEQCVLLKRKKTERVRKRKSRKEGILIPERKEEKRVIRRE